MVYHIPVVKARPGAADRGEAARSPVLKQSEKPPVRRAKAVDHDSLRENVRLGIDRVAAGETIRHLFRCAWRTNGNSGWHAIRCATTKDKPGARLGKPQLRDLNQR